MSDTGETTEQHWKQNRLIVLVSAVLVFGGFTLVMPGLPIYLRQLGITEVGPNALWAGTLIAIAPLLSAIVGPFWGWLADRFGYRAMALRAMVALAVSWIVFSLATHVFHLLMARMIIGLFGGYSAILIPLATAGCPASKVNETIGAVQSTRIASIALGPVVGGFLANWIGVQGTAAVTAGLSLLALVLFFFYRSPHKKEEEEDGAALPVRLADLLTNPTLLPLFLALFLVNFFDRGLGPIIPLFVLEMGTPPAAAAGMAGLIFSAGAVASTFSSWWAGRVADRWETTRLLRVLTVAGMAFCIPLAFCSSNLEMGVYRFLLGFVLGGVLTATYLMANRQAPAGSQASVMGILSSGALLGNALGPFCMGALASFGLSISLGVASLSFVALLWVCWRMKPMEPASR